MPPQWTFYKMSWPEIAVTQGFGGVMQPIKADCSITTGFDL